MAKKNNSKIVLVIGIFLGLGIILYPLFSQLYYDVTSEAANLEFREAVSEVYTPAEKLENIRLAEAYNEALEPNLRWMDPYSSEERQEGVVEYAHMLEVQEKIGIISIPTIDVEIPVYAGTNDSVLHKGAGHLEKTSLPVGGPNTHSVITAHRGLADKRLFRDLDKMEVGDIFYIESMAGTLYYQVDQIIIVEPTDTDTVMIEPGEDYLTLLTCDPYMINSHRLLVRGVRIEAPTEDQVVQGGLQVQKDLAYYLTSYWQYLVLILLALAIVIVIIFWERIRGKNRKK